MVLTFVFGFPKFSKHSTGAFTALKILALYNSSSGEFWSLVIFVFSGMTKPWSPWNTIIALGSILDMYVVKSITSFNAHW